LHTNYDLDNIYNAKYDLSTHILGLIRCFNVVPCLHNIVMTSKDNPTRHDLSFASHGLTSYVAFHTVNLLASSPDMALNYWLGLV